MKRRCNTFNGNLNSNATTQNFCNDHFAEGGISTGAWYDADGAIWACNTNDCDLSDKWERLCASPPSCTDGIQNSDETDTDCGGNCVVCNILDPENCSGRCDDGQQCSDGDDCQSQVCSLQDSELRCQTATCSDGTENGDETGTDCGGGCEPCRGSCNDNNDCFPGTCENGFCEPLCINDEGNYFSNLELAPNENTWSPRPSVNGQLCTDSTNGYTLNLPSDVADDGCLRVQIWSQAELEYPVTLTIDMNGFTKTAAIAQAGRSGTLEIARPVTAGSINVTVANPSRALPYLMHWQFRSGACTATSCNQWSDCPNDQRCGDAGVCAASDNCTTYLCEAYGTYQTTDLRPHCGVDAACTLISNTFSENVQCADDCGLTLRQMCEANGFGANGECSACNNAAWAMDACAPACTEDVDCEADGGAASSNARAATATVV